MILAYFRGHFAPLFLASGKAEHYGVQGVVEKCCSTDGSQEEVGCSGRGLGQDTPFHSMLLGTNFPQLGPPS